MKGREIVKGIMEMTGVTNADMAFKLKISQATLWDRLNTKKASKDIATSTLVDMLRELNYKVVVVPRDTRIPDGGYEIE